jgi:hypothetical protein
MLTCIHCHTRHNIFFFIFPVKNGKRQAHARTGSPPHGIRAVVTVRATDRWAPEAEAVNPPRFDVASAAAVATGN